MLPESLTRASQISGQTQPLPVTGPPLVPARCSGLPGLGLGRRQARCPGPCTRRLPHRGAVCQQQPGEDQAGLDLADTPSTQARDLAEPALTVTADHIAHRHRRPARRHRHPPAIRTGQPVQHPARQHTAQAIHRALRHDRVAAAGIGQAMSSKTGPDVANARRAQPGDLAQAPLTIQPGHIANRDRNPARRHHLAPAIGTA
jgi:hypothetical protein